MLICCRTPKHLLRFSTIPILGIPLGDDQFRNLLVFVPQAAFAVFGIGFCVGVFRFTFKCITIF